MKRFLILLVLVPFSAFAAYTEFYCQSGGSNLNSGSDSNNAAKYTSTNGNWTSATSIFVPTDGSNPVSAGVAVGDFASIYLDGATVGVCTARVTAVTNATNGSITVSSTAHAGATPTTGATGRTIKVGGAWRGPDGTSAIPFSYSSLNVATDASGDAVMINLKNDVTYSAGALTFNASVSGYSSTVRDGGRATIDHGVSAGNLITVGSAAFVSDLIVTSSASSGTGVGIQGGTASILNRITVTGTRGAGISSSGATVIQCEVENCNKSNTATQGGFTISSAGDSCIRCMSLNNTGNANDGFVIGNVHGVSLIDCVSAFNGRYGVSQATTGAAASVNIVNLDTYKNGSDGVHLSNSNNVSQVYISNSNFIKNTGWGVSIASYNGILQNNGYGSGTMANGSGDSSIYHLQEFGKVTYASGVTPWTAPDTGNFSINLPAAEGVGYGNFTETQGGYSGTVGYPDIGAAQANIGVAFPTPTPTPTATATPTATPTPTAPIETSYTFGS